MSQKKLAVAYTYKKKGKIIGVRRSKLYSEIERAAKDVKAASNRKIKQKALKKVFRKAGEFQELLGYHVIFEDPEIFKKKEYRAMLRRLHQDKLITKATATEEVRKTLEKLREEEEVIIEEGEQFIDIGDAAAEVAEEGAILLETVAPTAEIVAKRAPPIAVAFLTVAQLNKARKHSRFRMFFERRNIPILGRKDIAIIRINKDTLPFLYAALERNKMKIYDVMALPFRAIQHCGKDADKKEYAEYFLAHFKKNDILYSDPKIRKLVGEKRLAHFVTRLSYFTWELMRYKWEWTAKNITLDKQYKLAIERAEELFARMLTDFYGIDKPQNLSKHMETITRHSNTRLGKAIRLRELTEAGLDVAVFGSATLLLAVYSLPLVLMLSVIGVYELMDEHQDLKHIRRIIKKIRK